MSRPLTGNSQHAGSKINPDDPTGWTHPIRKLQDCLTRPTADVQHRVALIES